MQCKTIRNKGTGTLAVSCLFYKNFLKMHLQNLKYNAAKGMDFSFNFAWCSIQLGFVRLVQGVGVLLNRQNLLSVTKLFVDDLSRKRLLKYYLKSKPNRNFKELFGQITSSMAQLNSLCL